MSYDYYVCYALFGSHMINYLKQLPLHTPGEIEKKNAKSSTRIPAYRGRIILLWSTLYIWQQSIMIHVYNLKSRSGNWFES